MLARLTAQLMPACRRLSGKTYELPVIISPVAEPSPGMAMPCLLLVGRAAGGRSLPGSAPARGGVTRRAKTVGLGAVLGIAPGPARGAPSHLNSFFTTQTRKREAASRSYLPQQLNQPGRLGWRSALGQVNGNDRIGAHPFGDSSSPSSTAASA